MAQLINSKEVIDLAFSSVEQVSDWIVKESKIEAAQEKYIRPVFGKMYEAMQSGKYDDFVTEYIKPALAYYVRFGLIPDLSMKLGNNGVQMPYTGHTNAASDKQRELLMTQARDDAGVLLQKAIRHVEENPSLFPEYEKTENIKAKTLFKSGLILKNKYRE